MTFWNSCAASSVVRLPLLYRECVQNNQCRERRLSCLSWKWRKRSSVNILSVGRWCLRCSGWFSPAFSTRRVDFLFHQMGHPRLPRYLWPLEQVFQPPRFSFGIVSLGRDNGAFTNLALSGYYAH